MMHRIVALLIATAISVPSAASAQQPPMTVVTLLPGDKGMVDARAVATKDIVSHITSQRGARTGMHMVRIQTCPKVPPDSVQEMMKELQKRKFVVVLDLNNPDPRLCAR